MTGSSFRPPASSVGVVTERNAGSTEVRKDGPVRIPDGEGFYGPSRPTGGERPPADRLVDNTNGAQSPDQSQSAGQS